MRKITPRTPTKRKVVKEWKEKGSPKNNKKRKQNGDMKRYISCKKWREEETRVNHETSKEERTTDKLLGMGRSVDITSSAVTDTVTATEKEKEEEEDKLMGMGSRVDTTSQPVTVNMSEMAKSIIETLKTRWKEEKTGIERERVLSRIECRSNQDLQVHMLGWFCTRSDEQIKNEAIEMVGALEKVAYTRTITKKGESIMTDIVELCTMITMQVNTIIKSPPDKF
jgi:hypothetical protein